MYFAFDFDFGNFVRINAMYVGCTILISNWNTFWCLAVASLQRCLGLQGFLDDI